MQSAENGTISLQTRERLGEQLIYYRREHNLSLHDLSRMSGVDIRHIDNLEAGKTPTSKRCAHWRKRSAKKSGLTLLTR